MESELTISTSRDAFGCAPVGQFGTLLTCLLVGDDTV